MTTTPSTSQKSDRDLLLISVFTFFTVFLWVFFEVLKTVKTTTVSPQVTRSVVPFSPKLETEVIQTISAKRQY
jgi:hypothetical protein